MEKLAISTGDNYINSDRLRKSFGELTKEIGFSAATLGGDMLVSMTNLTERLGMSVEEATSLTTLLRLNGKNTQDQEATLGRQVSLYNTQNRLTFNAGKIAKDIASTSKAIMMNLNKNPQAIAAAVLEANKLGLSMSQLETVSSSLLDFESSINSELEARLLSGKELNLARARELSMTGDMGGLAKELANQEAVTSAFKTKNVIAQTSIAQILGISREELAKMVMQQQFLALGAEGFKSEWGETSLAQQESLALGDKFTAVMDKLKTVLVAMLTPLSPLLDALSWLLSSKLAPWFMGAAMAGLMLSGVLLKIGKGIKSLGSSVLGGVGGGTRGGGLGGALNSLGNVNWKSLAGGAVVMLAFAGSIWIFSKAMQNLEGIDLGKIAGTLGAFTLCVAAIMGVMSLLAESGVAEVAILTLGGTALAFMGFGYAVKLAGEGIKMVGEGFNTVISSITSIGLTDIANILSMASAITTLAVAVGTLNEKGPVNLGINTNTAGTATASGTTKPPPTSESSILSSKLDELIKAVRQGHDIYIDGNKLQAALHMGSHKSS